MFSGFLLLRINLDAQPVFPEWHGIFVGTNFLIGTTLCVLLLPQNNVENSSKRQILSHNSHYGSGLKSMVISQSAPNQLRNRCFLESQIIIVDFAEDTAGIAMSHRTLHLAVDWVNEYEKKATYSLSLFGHENEKINYNSCIIIHILYHVFRESASNYNIKQHKYVPS